MTIATSTLKPGFHPGGGRQQYSQKSPWPQYTWFSSNNWTPPSCPCRTAPPNPQPGILGPRPQHPSPQQHALYTTAPYYMYEKLMTTTDLDKAFNTMHLNPPDNTWYMDTGSTSHVANNEGNFSHLFSLSNPHSILVGSGKSVPVTGIGSTTIPDPNRPYHLYNVQHVPQIIKNLIQRPTCTTIGPNPSPTPQKAFHDNCSLNSGTV